jgi:23S rRNA (guanosine2251-2'-O)-methyltransferase
LDGITDPQNLGAIVRSAEVLGAGGIILPRDRNAGVTPAVVRASSGAAVHLPISQVVNLVRALEQVKDAGYWIVGLDAAGRSGFQELPPFERVAIVIGSEGKGIRPLVARACDFMVAIPVRGRVASLNAAAAAAIGIHELATRLSPVRVEPGDC